MVLKYFSERNVHGTFLVAKSMYKSSLTHTCAMFLKYDDSEKTVLNFPLEFSFVESFNEYISIKFY